MEPVDGARLGGWFDQYGRGLVLYGRQWLDQDTAEDVVQEVFLRACSSPTMVVDPKRWLFRSVRNAVIDRLRGRQRHATYEQAQMAGGLSWFQPRPDDLLSAEEVQRALECLPADQREIIVLRIWADMTFAEAAEVTGEAISTLSSRYQAGLIALRDRMEASCGRKKTT